MSLTRRQFLTLMGGSATAVAAAACGIPEKELLVQSPIEMPEDLVTGLDTWYATIDRQNRAPFGIVVRVMEGRAKKIEGNVDYPVNRGKHNAVAEAGLQGLYHPDRIGSPLIRTGQRGEGKWEQLSWTDGVSRVAERLGAASGEETVLITDPVSAHIGLVVNRFAESLGAQHMSYEPLERTVLKASMKQVFDQEAMPDFDIENAAYILSFGADFLNTWGSSVRYARGYGHFRQGEGRKRGKLVHFDSRFSMTAANADEWVYVKPGYEGEVALAIANVMITAGLPNSPGLQALTRDGSNRLQQFTPDAVGSRAGVSAGEDRQDSARLRWSHPPASRHRRRLGGRAFQRPVQPERHICTEPPVGQRGQVGRRHLQSGSGHCRPSDERPDATGVVLKDLARANLGPRCPPGRSRRCWSATPTLLRNAGERDSAMLGSEQASFNVPLIVSFSNRFDDTTMLGRHHPAGESLPRGLGTDSVPIPAPATRRFGFQAAGRPSRSSSRGPPSWDEELRRRAHGQWRR